MTLSRAVFAVAPSSLVFIEEERASTRPWRLVLAWHRETESILVRDLDTDGADWTPLATQTTRSRLAGAWVVAAETPTELAQDPRLVALDACAVTEDGDAPPIAHVVRALDELLAEYPDCELAHIERGALFGDAAYGDHVLRSGDTVDRFPAWYAEARERFPEAEWPLQIYARYLERQERVREASVAWLVARRRDDLDVRNAAGHGRALFALRRMREADDAFRRASTLDPTSASGWAWQCRTALATDDVDRAEACAEIIVAIADEESVPWFLLADVAERRGDLRAARRHLEHDRPSHAKRGADALAAARHALELEPENLDYFDIAYDAAILCDDVPAALALARELTRFAPFRQVGWERVGTLLACQLDDVDGALAASDRAVTIAPNREEAHQGRALALAAASRFTEARLHAVQADVIAGRRRGTASLVRFALDRDAAGLESALATRSLAAFPSLEARLRELAGG